MRVPRYANPGEQMDFKALYTTTDGRISRKTFWISAIVLAVVNIVISLLILPLVGLGGPNMAAIVAAANDPAQVSSIVMGAVQSSAWGSLVVLAIFAYPYYCISVKRRHDKNNNGIDVVIYLALAALLLVVQGLGLGMSVVEVQGMTIPMPNTVFTVLGAIVGIFGLYLLVVLGFLKGTDGTNQYGPDPLGGTAAVAA